MYERIPQDNDVRRVMDACLPGLEDRSDFDWEVFRRVRGEIKVKKRISAGLVLALVLFLLTASALAVVFNGYDITLYQEVNIIDLLPEQRQQYNVCHRLSFGYVVGGFELGEDYIAPMSEEMSISCLDDNFNPLWALTDSRLKGSLFDKVRETPNALYFGTERQADEWKPAIMKVSRSGNILWYYEGPPKLKIKDYIVTDAEDVYCVGSKGISNGKTPLSTAVALKMNKDGAVCWEKEYNADTMQSLSSTCLWNGQLIALGKSEGGAQLLMLSMDGDIRSTYTYETDEPITALRLQKAADGKLIMVLTIDVGDEKKDATSKIRYIILNPEWFI